LAASDGAVLATTTGAAELALFSYAVMALVLVTAGMTLLDRIDGSFINFAYGWAFAQPVRKV
jgi:high-affinity nickel-transport protein